MIQSVLSFFQTRTGSIFLIILIVSFGLRLPSLSEPFWYGDEGITFTMAQAPRNGLTYYKDIFDNKPPFSYLLATLSFSLLGESLWSARFVLMIWAIVTHICLFFLAREVLKQIGVTDKTVQNKWSLLPMGLFALATSTPYLEGNIYNGEILMILPVMLAMLATLKERYVLAGTLFATAALFKIPAIFDFLGLLAVLFVVDSTRFIGIKTFQNYLKLILSFLTVFVLVFLYFIITNNLQPFITSALAGNVSYTNTYNKFIIPNGLLLLKAIPIIIVIFVLKYKKAFTTRFGSETNTLCFLTIWLLFAYYGSLLSGRPYTHYIIQIIPPLTLITMLAIYKTLARWVLVGIVSFTVLLSFILFEPQFLGWNYYPNYIRFISGNMKVEDYYQSFDRKVTRNYIVSAYLKSKTKASDTVFIWANEPQVHFLTNRFPPTRYTTAYHLNLDNGALESTRKALTEKKPAIVVREKKSELQDEVLEQQLERNYLHTGALEDLDFYRRK